MKNGVGNSGEVTVLANRQDGTNIDFTVTLTAGGLLQAQADNANGNNGTLQVRLIRITA